MKQLDRYMLREISAPFAISLAAFLTVLCLNMVYFVLNILVEQDAPIRDVLQLIVLRIPFFLVLALPVAILLATSLAVNRLSRDRELIAFKMAGCSLWRLLLPFTVFGFILTGISFVTEEWVAPYSTHRSDDIYRRLLMEANAPALQPDTFFRSGNKMFYFRRAYRVGARTTRLEQVMMFQMNGAPFPEMWTAREALVTGDQWTLKGVVMHHLEEHGHAAVDAVPAGDVALNLHQDLNLFADASQLPEEMTAAKLREQVNYYGRLGIRGAILSQLEYEYYSKFALPVACLLCAIIGIPLNIRYARFGSFVGLFLALVAVFVYYNCMVLARTLAYNGAIPGFYAAWLPDILFGIVTLAFVYRER